MKKKYNLYSLLWVLTIIPLTVVPSEIKSESTNNMVNDGCSYSATLVLYVDADADPGGRGRSWASAYEFLQDAIASAPDHIGVYNGTDFIQKVQIWVVEGTYYPDEGNRLRNDDRNASFTMSNNVELYGGFQNGDNSLSNQNWVDHPTTQSGNIQQDRLQNNDSYHVLKNNYTSNTSINSTAQISGFTITYGNANASKENLFGGGMYNVFTSPRVYLCIFKSNQAISGAAVYNYESNPTFLNCLFYNNEASTNYESTPLSTLSVTFTKL